MHIFTGMKFISLAVALAAVASFNMVNSAPTVSCWYPSSIYRQSLGTHFSAASTRKCPLAIHGRKNWPVRFASIPQHTANTNSDTSLPIDTIFYDVTALKRKYRPNPGVKRKAPVSSSPKKDIDNLPDGDGDDILSDLKF